MAFAPSYHYLVVEFEPIIMYTATPQLTFKQFCGNIFRNLERAFSTLIMLTSQLLNATDQQRTRRFVLQIILLCGSDHLLMR